MASIIEGTSTACTSGRYVIRRMRFDERDAYHVAMTSLASPRAASRNLIVFAALAVLVASCQLPPEPERQIFVDAAFGFSGSESDAYLALGDVDTLLAQASAGIFLPELLCDSRKAPSCFSFSSSNPAVATIDTAGIVKTRGTGTTLLRVSYKGIDTTSIRLTVTPAAVALRAAPESVDVAVGDSIAVSITALDTSGVSVAGSSSTSNQTRPTGRSRVRRERTTGTWRRPSSCISAPTSSGA